MNPEDDPKGMLQSLLSGYRRIRENPLGDIAMGFTPAGVVADVEDAGRAIRDRDALGLMLAGAGFVPGIGDAAKNVGKAVRKGSVDRISRNWEKRGVESYIDEGDNYIRLRSVIVPESRRGEGLGTQFMDDLTDYSDQTGKPILLTPSTAYGASSKSRLEGFYKGFGFQPNAGRNRDFSLPNEAMIRRTGER